MIMSFWASATPKSLVENSIPKNTSGYITGFPLIFVKLLTTPILQNSCKQLLQKFEANWKFCKIYKNHLPSQSLFLKKMLQARDL